MFRAYISVDMEGMPGIVYTPQTSPRGLMHEEAWRIASLVVRRAAEKLLAEGFEEVYVADSHWHMGNIRYEDMPRGVTLLRGLGRPYTMVYGVEKGFDAALFLGYHSRYCTVGSVLDHTYSGTRVKRLLINGVDASEFYLNALTAGFYGVPVILVAGDDKLRLDVEEKAPWVEYVVFKESVSRYAAFNPSLPEALERLDEGIERAIRRLREGRVKPLRLEGRVEVTLTFPNSGNADAAMLIPGTQRIDGCTVSYRAENIVEAYKYLQAAVLVASSLESSVREYS